MMHPSGSDDTERPADDGDRYIWHRRAIRLDPRSPAEVEADEGWEPPWRRSHSAERKQELAKVNPYITRVDEYAGIIVPMEEAEGMRGRWQTLFDAPRPLIVELGCGAGHFLRDEAALRPGFNYLGVELRYKRLVQAVTKTRQHPNVRYVRAHSLALEHLFEPGELGGAWIQFPDPWPKNGQATKRMVNPALVRMLATALRPGGTVRLKSDWPPYLDWFRGSFAGSPFVETAFVADLRAWDLPWTNVQTSFEARFMREGKPCFFLEYTLPGGGEASDGEP